MIVVLFAGVACDNAVQVLPGSLGNQEISAPARSETGPDNVFEDTQGGVSDNVSDATPNATPNAAPDNSPENTAADESVPQDTDATVSTEDLVTDNPETVRPPSEDDPVIVRPDAPGDLLAMRYSATAGELFWSAAPNSGARTRYSVEQDGEILSTVTSTNFYTETLVPGVAHEMAVYTLDENGVGSAPTVIKFNSKIDIQPPKYPFDLNLDRLRGTLQEGSSDGARFEISVAPDGREQVSLSVTPSQAADAKGVIVQLGKASLDRDDPATSVIFRLPIGMQPIFPHTRTFKILATSGDEVRSADIVLDVEPTTAPDVYLLIGQSNMVGSSEAGAKDVSPGGSDERNERIRQLNVTPNTGVIFGEKEDFLDESLNAIRPRFILAEDPLHDPRSAVVSVKGGTSVGPGLSFAKAALTGTTQSIYLVPAAWGASGFCQAIKDELAWNASRTNNAALAGTSLLERALTRLRMTLSATDGVFRAILWHQGGADSNDQACADSYADNLKRMVERLRREAAQDSRGASARGSNAPIPFIVATQSKGKDNRGDFSDWSSTKRQVDAVHRGVSGLLPFADWVNNDDLVPPAYPCGSGSCVHFGAAANREVGRRYYDALKRIWSRGY